jgi:hypothetical protein
MPHFEAPRCTWVCQYCALSSLGGTLHCTNCGFPAHTSAFELERAKRLGSVQEFLNGRHLQTDDWRRKPLPKKILIVAGVSLFAVGVFLLSATAGWKSMALGAAMLGASVLLLWLGS